MVHTRPERLKNDQKYNLQGGNVYIFESFQQSLAFVIIDDDEDLRFGQIDFFCLSLSTAGIGAVFCVVKNKQ